MILRQYCQATATDLGDIEALPALAPAAALGLDQLAAKLCELRLE
jgi:hypothetical protein